MKFIVSASTDIGIKKAVNQDAAFVRRIMTPVGEMVLAVLCDGMGGLKQGENASATVIDAFTIWQNRSLRELSRQQIDLVVLGKQWYDLTTSLNSRIRNYGKNRNIRIGTTLCAMLLTQKDYYVINVGDTRAYEINGGIRQITHDHSIVGEKVRKGEMTTEESEHAPKRNVLTQCVGGGAANISPDLFSGKVLPDCAYMLCSDGFRHEINAAEFTKHICPTEISSRRQLRKKELFLIDINKQRGESDNISVITVISKQG